MGNHVTLELLISAKKPRFFHRYLLVLASAVGAAPSPRFSCRRNRHGIGIIRGKT